MKAVNAYLGLGSNIQHPYEQLQRAIAHITQLDNVVVLACSRFYCAPFAGNAHCHEVVNVVLKLSTTLSPGELLNTLLALEKTHQRTRIAGVKGDRTLDCDILLYGNEHVDEPDLVIPHPRMTARDFVILPLLDIEPDLRLPNGKRVDCYRKNIVVTGEFMSLEPA